MSKYIGLGSACQQDKIPPDTAIYCSEENKAVVAQIWHQYHRVDRRGGMEYDWRLEIGSHRCIDVKLLIVRPC